MAAKDVVALAPVAIGGSGVVLTDETTPAQGVPAGTTASYQVVVPKAGTYQVGYQAHKGSGNPSIRLTVTGPGYSTTVHDTAITNASMPAQPIAGPSLTLTNPGTYTVTVSAPSGGHGWVLDWLRFQRT